MNIKGIDISEWNGGKLDFKAIKKDGVDYVIIRAGYGRYISQKDPWFERNYKYAKAAGLKVGAYWYSYAKTAEQAKEEAKTCLEAIKGKQFEYPIYFDLEEESQFKLGKEACSKLVTAFCSEIERSGYFAGLYCSTYWLNYVNDDVKKKYTLWVAEYADACHYKGAGTVDMWQKSSTYKIAGTGNTNTYFDLDECYRDFPRIIKDGGFNGFPKKGKAAEGDYDGDGRVTDADAMKALEASAGLTSPTKAETARADLNKDGKVTAADARDILKIARKKK